jgi:hypothetical protein
LNVSPNKENTALRLERGLLDALREIKAREGISVTAQVQFAIRDWLKKKGMTTKADRRRAQTRRRS